MIHISEAVPHWLPDGGNKHLRFLENKSKANISLLLPWELHSGIYSCRKAEIQSYKN